MRILAGLIAVGLALSGCAKSTSSTASGQPFTGEIWTWSEQQNVVTLRQGPQIVRVKVEPDQLVGLQLHQVRTIRGTLAPPMEIERVMQPPPANYSVVPRGASDRAEVTGKLVTVDPNGTVSISSSRGTMRVWVASPNVPSLKAGNDVKLRVAVQPVDIVPRAGGTQEPPTVAVQQEPGDYAVVVGKVTQVDPSGRITVESPRGPVQVSVTNASQFKVGDMVQVSTSVHPS
jgi:hypothetical protein